MTNTTTTITPAPAGGGMAIASLVLGCCSILFFWLYGIVPILAIIFGGVSISQTKAVGQRPNGMAIAGLVLGIVFANIALFMFLAILGGS